MKRMFAALLCVCVLLSLVGCGDGGISAEIGEGILSSFSAADLDGNMYSEEILRDKKLTMVNVWGTFCGPCIEEMPYLGQLHDAYADRGFQVVGIVIDVTDQKLNPIPAAVADAKDIIARCGADYLHLLPSASLNEAFLARVQAVPVTYFVNADGHRVGAEYLGAKSMQEWEEIIQSLLSDNGD